jgi:cell wall-associated NlpC family hydrolase
MPFVRILAAGLTGWALAGLAGCSSTAPRRSPVSPLDARESSEERPTDSRAIAAVEFAAAQVGKRYCWGGTGPECFDCSGLVMEAWGSVGVRLPRTTGAIASGVPEVPIDDVRVGDILWWPGHVGLYAGGGFQVDALDKQHGVVRRPAREPVRAFRPL